MTVITPADRRLTLTVRGIEDSPVIDALSLGPITIGAHSVVGANAVVTKDAPADSVLVGVPARPRARRAGEDTRALLTAPEYSI